MEDAIRHQVDNIAYLRSFGLPWAEAVYQLRDMVVGLEDEEFWDGIPQPLRDDTTDELREKYARYGWDGVPCRAFEGPGGEPMYRPTPEDLSEQLRIIMRLLYRRGITWKRLRTSRLGSLDEDADESAQG